MPGNEIGRGGNKAHAFDLIVFENEKDNYFRANSKN